MTGVDGHAADRPSCAYGEEAPFPVVGRIRRARSGFWQGILLYDLVFLSRRPHVSGHQVLRGKMMNRVLRTGAGFSANWGGRLAREVNTAVARRVGDDANLAALLHRNPNFEEALAELQNAAAISPPGAKEQLQRLEAGIVDSQASSRITS
jgi:hypothetical protein